jgi:hypothetical protein
MSNFKYTRPDSLPPIVKNLIIINVLVWLAQKIIRQAIRDNSKISIVSDRTWL